MNNSIEKEAKRIWDLYYSYNKSDLMFEEDAVEDTLNHVNIAIDLIINTLNYINDDSLKRGSFNYDFVSDGYTKGAYEFYQDVKKHLKLKYA